MDEKNIEKVKRDTRVKFNYLVNNKINTFSAIPKDSMNKMIIYCHGLGSNKTWAARFYDDLLKNKIGIISFDFPGHGADKTDFSLFNLSLCINYLEEIIAYVKTKYNVPIYLFGCSFGGFIVLNKLIRNNINIEKTMLMCPAINFCEIMERKSGISLDYFETNTSMSLYNNIKIYKDAYLEFKNGDNAIKKYKFQNISIIHGTSDKTVLYKDISDFCKKNNLKLTTIKYGKHELYNYDNEIIKFLLKSINEKGKLIDKY